MSKLLLIFIYAVSIVIGIQIISRMAFSYFDYDEGYNLQVTAHIHQNVFNYSTFQGVLDPNITTGPALLFPEALFYSFKNPFLPRFIFILYTAALLYICIAKILSNNIQRVGFVCLLAYTPLYYFFSSHILGEIPAFVYFLASLVLLHNKKYFLSGIFLAFSIITKNIFAIGFIPIVYLIYYQTKDSKKVLVPAILTSVCGFLIPFLLWNLYVFFILHGSISQYMGYIHAQNTVNQSLSYPRPELFASRIEMFTYVFGIYGFLFLLGTVGMCIYTLVKLRKNRLIAALASFYTVYMMYFLFLGHTNWYRHVFPAILTLPIIIPYFISTFIHHEKKKYQIVLCACIATLILNIILSYATGTMTQYFPKKVIEQNLIFSYDRVFPYLQPDPLLVSQMRTKLYIQNHISPQDNISGINWWNAPEISYLTNRPINRNPFTKNTNYFIHHIYGKLLGVAEDKSLSQLSDHKVFQTFGYDIYKK